jgi:WD40 repeat protein
VFLNFFALQLHQFARIFAFWYLLSTQMNEEASNGEEEAATIQLSFVESYSLGGIPSPAATEVAVQAPTLTCHAFVEDKVRRVLIGGLSDGDVLIWKPKRESSKGKTADMTTVALKGHRGAVHCLSYIPELGPDGLLLTGSADRTIRVWYPWNRNTASACVQVASLSLFISFDSSS